MLIRMARGAWPERTRMSDKPDPPAERFLAAALVDRLIYAG